MSIPTTLIQRYTTGERLNHWLVAFTFILLALSGLALFHPAFFFLSAFLGGGTWARILHPYLGVLMIVAFLGLTARFWSYSSITEVDRQWLRQFRDVLAMRTENLPPVGRFNAGQKAMFWLMLATLLLLFISGLMFWQPKFAPFIPVGLRRLAVVVHAASAVVLMGGLVIHIYAAIWVKGSLRAMLSGEVSPAWAKKHYPLWWHQLKEGSK